MRVQHIGIWVKDLDLMREFYKVYFGMKSGPLYTNEKKKFSSYFLSYTDGAKIELMHRPDIEEAIGEKGMLHGLAHIAITLGSRNKVDQLTENLRKDGYPVKGIPRLTGDGHYESVILDPEGNIVEIVA